MPHSPIDERLVQVTAWCWQESSKMLPEPMLTHIYVTKPQRVKWSQLAFIEPMHQCNSFDSLWLSDAIWQHRTWSTLVQEMAWCRQATSHYLNQCCLIIHQVLWHSLEGKYIGTAIIDMSLKCTDLRLQPHLPGAIELKNWYLQVKSTGTLSSNELQWLDKEGEGTRKIVSLMAVRWQVLFLALTWQDGIKSKLGMPRKVTVVH